MLNICFCISTWPCKQCIMIEVISRIYSTTSLNVIRRDIVNRIVHSIHSQYLITFELFYKTSYLLWFQTHAQYYSFSLQKVMKVHHQISQVTTFKWWLKCSFTTVSAFSLNHSIFRRAHSAVPIAPDRVPSKRSRFLVAANWRKL